MNDELGVLRSKIAKLRKEEQTMTVINSVDWHVFERRLSDYAKAGVPCDRNENCTLSRKILADMGLSAAAIRQCIRYFHEHGGYCDCEVAFNVLDKLIESQPPHSLLH